MNTDTPKQPTWFERLSLKTILIVGFLYWCIAGSLMVSPALLLYPLIWSGIGAVAFVVHRVAAQSTHRDQPAGNGR